MTPKALSYLTLCALALAGCTPRYANGDTPRYGDRVHVVAGFYRGTEGKVVSPDCDLSLDLGWGVFTAVRCDQVEPIK